MSAAVVKEAWDRIEAWCRRHHPGLLDTLNPGASEKDVAAVERQIGQPLPEDVRESLFRVREEDIGLREYCQAIHAVSRCTFGS